MRLIYADKLLERLAKKKPGAANNRYTDGFNDAIMCFRSMVHGSPTVDAVPVVRCRDCKHWVTGAENFCAIDGQSRKSYWFCADGERKGRDE